MNRAKFSPIVPDIPKILYGGDYNPEQWPEEVWEEDVRLMVEAGVNFISLGIFAWAFLESAPGRYDFSWLRRVLDLLDRNKIGVCMATATASPPAWFTRKFPESRPVNSDGVMLDLGSRQHYCPNSPEYRQYADRLVIRLTREIGSHPAVKMWHLNNEIGCHVQACFCPRCDAAFRSWLLKKYVTLDNLNEAWGTAFWSQHYTDWEQICTPRRMPTFKNPGHFLDYRRFFSEALGSVAWAELAVIRSEGNTLPSTTNGIGFYPPCDYFKWYGPLDVASWDSYPDPVVGLAAARSAAFGHDLNRSMKSGRPFLLMEQVTSQVNWRPVNMLKPPGVMCAQNYQAVARGADACMFFQWRASKAGAEKFHGALVPHYGASGRIFREVKELGQKLKSLDSVVGQSCSSGITLLASWDNRWAVELESKPTQFCYGTILEEIHGICWDLNLMTNIAPPAWEISPDCKLIIAPLCYMLSADEADRLRQFVAAGGILVITYFSGIVDEREHIGLGGYPSMLTDVLGIRVEEWQPYPESQGNTIRWSDGHRSPVSRFAEVLHTTGARVLANYEEDFFAGGPAVTENSFGTGRAFYVSTHLSPAEWRNLISRAADEAGLMAPAQTSAGVEAVQRGNHLFLINHTSTMGSADIGKIAAVELVSGKTADSFIEIEPFGVRVLATT